MIFRYVTNLGPRSMVLLLTLAGLLIWSGRSDASALVESAVTPIAGPLFDRIQPGSHGAELTIRGEVAVLQLPGGDATTLASRLADGESAQVIVRIGGEDVLVAELRSLTLHDASLEAVARRLFDDPDGIHIGDDESSVLASALRTSAASEEAPSERRPAATQPAIDAPFPTLGPGSRSATIPEPATAALLATGLLGLIFASRRRT